jgi:serine/threonine protein phosphatase PrpC
MQAIIDRFRASYATYRWARIIASAGLCAAGIALLAMDGGFPPWAWRLLFQVTPQFSRVWAQRGLGMLPAFVGLLLLALTLFFLWGLIVLAVLFMARDWLKRRREVREFAQDLAGAEAAWATIRANQSFAAGGREARRKQGEAGGHKGSPHIHSASLAPTEMQSGRGYMQGAPEMQPGWGRGFPAVPVGVVDAGEELPASAVSLDVGTALDAGIKRKGQPNEDSLLALPRLRASRKSRQPLALFVVADGMGGHGNGQEASRLAIAAIHDALQLALRDMADDDIYEELLAEGVHNANMAIHRRNRQKQADMGTTMTAALIAGNTAHIANVGDSRTYLYREDEGLSQITRDHSAVARLVEVGAITPREVYSHPKRNEIYRSLGNSASVKVDTYNVPLKVGDLLLLCSDGLWEMVHDDEIEQVIASWLPSPAHICDALLQAALQGGGKDNIGIIAVRVKSD